jgi:hypothetical protein
MTSSTVVVVAMLGCGEASRSAIEAVDAAAQDASADGMSEADAGPKLRAPEPVTGPELASITIEETGLSRPIPADFLGLSIEFDSVRPSLGVSADNANEVFLQLLRNLGAGTLRIGGNSSDYSCWNPSSGPRAKGCLYDVTPVILGSIAHAASATGFGVILGSNLAVDTEARALTYAKDGVAKAFAEGLVALEIGNEPNLYEARKLRPAAYDVSDYEAEWTARAKLFAQQPETASLPLAGPAIASGSTWEDGLASLVAKTKPALITTHRYALGGCSNATRSIDELLSDATRKATEAWAVEVAKVGAAAGRPVRVAETNSISCSGQKGVSDTFASALWATEHLYALARAGLAGANLHLWQNSSVMHGFGDYNAITAKGIAPATPGDGYAYDTHVRPLYYALAFFAGTRGEATIPAAFVRRKANLGLHAVRATCDGSPCVRVVVINADAKASGHVILATQGPSAHASTWRLEAPSLDATTGVTLGEASVDETTGALAAPTRTRLDPEADGRFIVNVPYASATAVEIVAE